MAVGEGLKLGAGDWRLGNPFGSFFAGQGVKSQGLDLRRGLWDLWGRYGFRSYFFCEISRSWWITVLGVERWGERRGAMRVRGLRKWVGGGTPEIGRTEVGSLWLRMSSVKSWRTSRRRQLLEGHVWQPERGSGLGRTTEVQLHSPSFFFFSHSPSFYIAWIFLKIFIYF